MTTPPRLYAVPEDGPGVSLLKDAGAVEFTPEVIEPQPVDLPPLAADGWMADRRVWMATAPSVLPSWLRDGAELAGNAQFVISYYSHLWAFHGVRAPVYGARLWLRAPHGANKLRKRWWGWVIDADAKPVTAKAAAGSVDDWAKHALTLTNRTTYRRKMSLVIGIPAAVLVYIYAFTLPASAWEVAAAGLLTALGAVGRQSDRPIVHRYVAVRLQRKLDSDEVENALLAIGIKGDVDWANPIQTDGPGWRAELDLPPGVTVSKVLEKREELAAAMRRPISTVWPEGDRDAHPGRLRLWVAREDPAKAKRKLWPLMHEGQADVFGALPFGFDPRGNLVTVTLMYSNLLVGGIPGSGKTSCALAIVLGVALDPTAELHIYELKGSGDLDSVRPVCHRYVSGDEDEDLSAAIAGLRAGITEQKRRAAFIKSLPAAQTPEGRRVTRTLAERYPEQSLGPRVIVIDEAQELFTHPELKDEAADLCTRLIKKGRAYGIIVVLLTQNPDAPSLPSAVSSSVGTRLCLAVMDWRANNNVLGTGAHERGMRATEISVSEQGTGILVRGREGGTVRAAFIKQTEAEQIGKRALALRIAAGTLSGEAAGEVLEDADESDLLDHLRAVWPAQEETMHSHRLVEALATLHPDLYGSWMATDGPMGAMTDDEARAVRTARSTMLATALKPYGVSTQQVQKRGSGGGAKGVRWVDLQGALGAREPVSEGV